MRHLDTIAQWRDRADEIRRDGHSVGLVATMGALHAGHRALITAARERGDVVIVTIFVNPRQFNDPADLEKYPRDLDSDLALCADAGADTVVTPTTNDMWPSGASSTATTVSVSGVSDRFEGAGRPGHFDGVASVVTKLFIITGPCRSYFGEKDFQQLAVVRHLVADLALPVDIIGVPIVRDDDGLALSSRNVLLSASARERALALSRAVALATSGRATTASGVRRILRDALGDAEIEVAYADVVDPTTLLALSDENEGPARVLLAGIVDGVRLVDNGALTIVKGH